MLVYPARQATELLRFYRALMSDAPDELNVTVAFLTAPPEPLVPDNLQGQPAVGILVCYVGDTATGQRLVAPLREAFPPAVDLVGPMPYEVHQTLMDATTPWGRQVFLKSANLKELSDEVIDTVVDYASRATSPMTLRADQLLGWCGPSSR